MGDERERTEAGDLVFRHQARERDFEAPQHYGLHAEEIEKHLETHVGKVDLVLHEIISDLIHLDVLLVRMPDDGPIVLVTSGVSDRRMNAPEGREDWAHAELLIQLPSNWPLDEDALKDDRWYWPIRWLKVIGRFPHEFETWIGPGHSIPNGDPAEQIADTPFTGLLLMRPYALPEEFFRLKTKSGETVTFLELAPLHESEMDFKLKHGADELEDRLLDQDDWMVDPERPSVA